MTLTQKLIRYLHRIFSKDPVEFLALRLRYTGSMSWRIHDAVLTTEVSGGDGASLSVDLSGYTLAELASYLSAQPGYYLLSSPPAEYRGLSARVLLDGGSDQLDTNGDHIYGFTALEWAYEDAMAVELKEADRQVDNALLQMSIPTAEGEWLDLIGSYYNVLRYAGEPDSQYGPRIIYEVLVPRNNNKAIEVAISRATGGLAAKVVDVVDPGDLFPVYSGDIKHQGAYHYNTSGKPIRNLFDVQYQIDLETTASIDEMRHWIRLLIDKFRAAGTHLRQVSLSSALVDSIPFSANDGELNLTIFRQHSYNGLRTYGSGAPTFYNSGETTTETISG